MERVGRYLARWGLLDLATVAALLLRLHGQPSDPTQPPPGSRVYTVHQAMAGLAQHPARWLGRTVWVRGVWGGVCPPYPNAGCAQVAVGRSVYALAAASEDAWSPGEALPLAEIFGSADSPGKWVAKERSGHSAAYQVRLARLDPRWCPFVDAGMGANGPGNPGMKPCLGGELDE